jgi:hypothetical protein
MAQQRVVHKHLPCLLALGHKRVGESKRFSDFPRVNSLVSFHPEVAAVVDERRLFAIQAFDRIIRMADPRILRDWLGKLGVVSFCS